ncbi:hypothetical protein M440DRAFT_1400987, partial [Trichoderma longibrachiatum ATCC 18648]
MPISPGLASSHHTEKYLVSLVNFLVFVFVFHVRDRDGASVVDLCVTLGRPGDCTRPWSLVPSSSCPVATSITALKPCPPLKVSPSPSFILASPQGGPSRTDPAHREWIVPKCRLSAKEKVQELLLRVFFSFSWPKLPCKLLKKVVRLECAL